MDSNIYSDKNAGIYLRLMTYEDTDMIVKWRNTPDVRDRFIYRQPFTREGHISWIKNKIETGQVVQFVICNMADHKPLGSVYVRDIDMEHKKGEYGIFIGEADARGRGVGTAAAGLMLKYCFEELKLHRVYLRALADNTAAIRSYEKAGFKREGLLVDDVCIDGSYLDIVWMAAVNK